MSRPLGKVLIANRGEIAVRVMRTCREMGLRTVAVFSEADRAALHVRLADEAYLIGPPPAAQSYLVIERIIDAAQRAGADAIHPGYGFLAENEQFAAACAAAGIVFVGPPPAAIAAMGDKTTARARMTAAGVPVVPGDHGVNGRGFPGFEEALAAARQLGFPVMLKASAGGGGKGMRLVESEAKLKAAFDGARRESASAFGDDTVYLEKAIVEPHHVEVQVFADEHGNVIHLGERDCSIQRRHQKVIEETPSPIVSEAMRARMGEVAVKAARAVGYVGAGTIEFLVDAERHFYFLEMNTRLQVEHPVTEMVTGIDIVKAQLRIAAGERLRFTQGDVSLKGHALECRIYAEDPDNGFVPCPGRIASLHEPSGPGIRNDNGMYEGIEIPIHYDPLISKLVAHAPSRDEAVDRMLRALKEMKIGGIKTNIPYFMRILADPDFRAGRIDTAFLDRHFEEVELALPGEETLEELERVALLAVAVRHLLEVSQTPCACPEAQKCNPWRLAARRRLVGS